MQRAHQLSINAHLFKRYSKYALALHILFSDSLNGASYSISTARRVQGFILLLTPFLLHKLTRLLMIPWSRFWPCHSSGCRRYAAHNARLAKLDAHKHRRWVIFFLRQAYPKGPVAPQRESPPKQAKSQKKVRPALRYRNAVLLVGLQGMLYHKIFRAINTVLWTSTLSSWKIWVKSVRENDHDRGIFNFFTTILGHMLQKCLTKSFRNIQLNPKRLHTIWCHLSCRHIRTFKKL